MTLRHNNQSQMVTPTELSPLLKNESPYYNNLNRAPKNAYDYADNINKVLSYGGYVSRMRPANIADSFNLYNVVKLLDGESLVGHMGTVTNTDRFGIIVTERDSDGYYIVCTFCPNFVYPSEIATYDSFNLQENLYVDTENYQSNPNGLTLSLPPVPVCVGRVTGTQTIFFCGTTRLFPEPNLPEGV